MVRDYIVSHPEEWEAVIQNPEFTDHFTVCGSTLKNVPNGYDKEHSQAEFLKMKSWYLEYPLTDDEICDGEKLLSQAVKMFRLMKPFNDYLNKALAGFEMPAR